MIHTRRFWVVLATVVGLIAFARYPISQVQGASTNNWWQAILERFGGNSGWKNFHSDKYGYTVKYPNTWEVKENSTENTREVRLTAKDKTALVKINAYHEPGMNTTAKVSLSIAAMKAKMYTEKTLRVTAFKESTEGEVSGYIAQGYQKIDGEDWRFENRGLLATNDRVLIMHGAVKPPSSKEQWKIVYEIMKGFALDK